MPRLKQREVPFQSVNRLLRSYGLNGGRLAPILECSEPTARKKLQNPGLFTLKDLVRISVGVPIPMEEIRESVKR